MAGILAEYQTVLGQNAGVGLICVMSSLKLLEIKTKRDLIVTVFINYFVIITNLLFSNSILMTAYMLFAVFAVTAALIFYTQNSIGIRKSINLAGSLSLRALPLMVVFFILFPRIQGTLWKGFRVSSGVSGFSDTLAPGEISNMALTGDVAFRVEFRGERPLVNELYWKGIVYGSFDGRAWKRSMSNAIPAYNTDADKMYEYIITQEPNNSRYMFVSGCPVQAPEKSTVQTDGTVRSDTLISERIKYRVVSEYSCNRLKQIKPSDEFKAIPAYGNYLSVSMAEKWRKELNDNSKIINAAFEFLKNGGFTYSLRPPKLMTGDPVDEFLFSTKKGYCEHYASSFAFLMRAAGIPSRVIGGYLGGNVNPVGGHITVTQDKAHAWVEVYSADKGWILLDPTSVVVPDILSRGLSAAVPANEMPVLMRMPDNELIGAIWKRFAGMIDYVNHGWNNMVIGYSYSSQKNLFKILGINPEKVSGALFLLFFVFLSSALVFVLTLKIRFGNPLKKKDPVKWAWFIFCSKMKKAGVSKEYFDGPMDYLEKISALRPEYKSQAEEIIEIYIKLRYTDVDKSEDNLKKFELLVKKFSVR